MRERRERLIAAPIYPQSAEIGIEWLAQFVATRPRLDPPMRRRLSGALNLIAQEGEFTPAEVVVPLARPVVEQYLNHPRPPPAKPVIWPDQPEVAARASLVGGAVMVKPTIVGSLTRVVRMSGSRTRWSVWFFPARSTGVSSNRESLTQQSCCILRHR